MSASVDPEHYSAEERSLIQSIVSGNAQLFTVLVDRYQQRLFGSMLAMIGNRQDAEDLTQETFLTAYHKLVQFENRSSFYTWLHRIAFNLAIDLQRRKGRTTKRHIGEDLSESTHLHPTNSVTPQTIAMTNEIAMQVQQALSKLDSERKNIIVLRDIEGLDYSEIAVILELPIGTVRSRLHRARMELREILQMSGVTNAEGSQS